MNKGSVESYLQDGCGRCDKYQTPDCKVLRWTAPLVELRKMLASTPLDEQLKWGSPCYTLAGKNVAMIGAFNDGCALSFFKGALLTDEAGLLVPPGPNSQAARVFKCTNTAEVKKHKKALLRLLDEAIAVEKAGKEVAIKKAPEPMPEELQAALDADPKLKAAFEALTPGRQRSHILHVSGAKQSKTRANRAAKCAVKIRAGKGFLDR